MDVLYVSHECVIKLKHLLWNVFKPNFVFNSNSSLLHFSTEENENDGIVALLLHSNLITEWLIKACNFWDDNEEIKPSTDLGCLAFKLATLASKDQERFVQLSIANIYLRLCDTFHVRQSGCPLEIRLEYVKLLKSFLQHKKGVEWIRTTNTWTDILNYSLGAKSINNDLSKHIYNFIYKLLESEIYYDKLFCKIVVKQITQPFTINSFIGEEQMKKKLTPTLRLINNILEQYLINEWHTQQHKHIPRIFIEEYKLLEIVTRSSFLTDEELICDIVNTSYLIHFIMLCINSEGYMISEEESSACLKKIFQPIEEAIHRKQCNVVLGISHVAIKYWYLIHTRLLPITQKDIAKNPLRFQNQILPLQIMPLMLFLEERFQFSWTLKDLDELRDFHLQQCFGKLCQYSVHLVYGYINALFSNFPYKYEITMRSLDYLMESNKYYEQETAVIFFRSQLYLLHDTIAMAKEDEKRVAVVSGMPDFFFAIIYSIRTLIEIHDIKWGKCLESACVVNVVLDVLQLTIWPTNLTIEALKLLKLSIEKYMSPNLTLLVDKTSDSSLAQMGPILLSKLHDKEWKIRECSLQVLIIISELCYSKFLSFQDLLQEENFPTLVFKMCERDPESYVRASALKCLQQMIQSDILWNKCLKRQKFMERIVDILGGANEANIRVEAVALIHSLYACERIEQEKVPEIYQIMATVATIDFHWEVKKNALKFWDEIIRDSLKDQGMIDRIFPEFIFSKERKKIISLDKEEIAKRLNKVLKKLYVIQCLQVLIKIIQDDFDIEVVQAAIEITNKLSKLLKKYDMNIHYKEQAIFKPFFELISQNLDEVLEQKKQLLNNRNILSVLDNDVLESPNNVINTI